MSKKETCAERKAQLMADLGERCAMCSSNSNLQFDCIIPNGKAHHGKSKCDRIFFYTQEHSRGNLQLLCASCNQRKSITDKKFLQAQKAVDEAKRNGTYSEASPEADPEPSPSDWLDWCAWHRRHPKQLF